MLAKAGAERWMRRNVEMNGADPCAIFVRKPDSVELALPPGLALSLICAGGSAVFADNENFRGWTQDEMRCTRLRGKKRGRALVDA